MPARKYLFLLAAIGFALILPAPVEAGFMLVADPSQVGATDHAIWNNLGGPTPTPLSFTTLGGANLSILAAAPNPGASVTSPNVGGETFLEVSGGQLVSLTIAFDRPVSEFGANIVATTGRGFFSLIWVEALDVNGTLLPSGSFTLAFASGGVLNPGSARFTGYAGIGSDQANIYQLRFSAGSQGSSGFSDLQLGTLDFNSPSVATVPAPPSAILLGSGCVALAAWGRWRRFATGQAR